MLLRILVAGPERDRIARLLSQLDALVTKVGEIRDVLQRIDRKPLDIVLLDVGRAAGATLELIREVRRRSARTALIALTERASAEQRARCVAAGCAAVVELGVADTVLAAALAEQAEQFRSRHIRQPSHVPGEKHGLGDYAASSSAMRAFLSAARRIADRDTTVLVLGETGVGKGLFARSLHNEGPRSDGPFVTVNCGSLSETLIESEIFGHERGSFTGADRSRRGYFEIAHGGTIFLDEVSEIPVHLQVKLLRVLEDRRIQPLGAERPVEVDVRLIAASNRDLAREVEEKRFRSDLYYRLNVVSIAVPPLRERREDIPELARSYLEHFARRLHVEAVEFSREAIRLLVEHRWPGNVRELINAVERAVLMSSGSVVGVDDLPADLAAPPRAGPEDDLLPAAWPTLPWSAVRRGVLERAELRYLSGVLEAAGGRINDAARRAGMDPRSLFEKMRRYGLRKEDFRVQE